MLTDHERGDIIRAIEWVTRGAKPIAECGCRSVQNVAALQAELQEVIRQSQEPVKGYVLEIPALGMWAYGVYLHPWAIEARVFLERKDCPDWLQGLIFGYSSDAIQRFMSLEQASNERLSCASGTVGIVRRDLGQSCSRSQTTSKGQIEDKIAQ